MRSKNPQTIQRILFFINDYYKAKGQAPTLQQIGDAVNMNRGNVKRYLDEMVEKGILTSDGGWRGCRTKEMLQEMQRSAIIDLPIVGDIACGTPILAEENIEEYISLSSDFLKGGGIFFGLRAKGDSMINAGISSGDYVIARMQPTAEEGQIVVALIDDEATLKRYYIDKENKRIRLHPENEEYEDMYFDNIIIQGVVVKVIKNYE